MNDLDNIAVALVAIGGAVMFILTAMACAGLLYAAGNVFEPVACWFFALECGK